MVGVLTMSSPVEDYTVQPCKKQRKDEDPSIKTITNYFSPLTKTKEKILVSPRPSNITDYFKRNYPACETEQTPVTEINISGQDSEIELLSSYSPPTSVTGHLRVSGKLTKGRKRVNMCRRVSDLSGKREGDSGSESHEITDTENVCKNTGFMGSDTAALLAEICSKREDLYERNQLETPKSLETSSKHCSDKTASPKYKNSCSKSRNHKHDEDKGEHANSVKEDNEYLEDKLSGISTTSLGSTNTTNTSLDVNVGDTTPRNDSVCTVYFNDFLKSQEKRDSETLSDGKGTVLDCSVSSNGENENSAGQGNEMPAQNPSPKTVTVRAQVHLSPPLQTTCSQSKVPKKIASIFLKKKDEVGKKADELTCKQEHADHMTQKRKSNVVVSEEDLELAVLDVESIEPIKQKCTAVERQQFMKAFRQPGEGGKNAGKKSLGKKDPSEMSTKDGADSHSRADDCPPLNMTGKEECQKQIQADKQEKTQELKNMKEKRTVRETTAKRANKRKAEHTSDATTEVTSSPLTSPGLRRSSRYRASAIKSPVKSPPVTDCPIQMSTPKVRVSCRKSDIYRAEVISAPSDVESPIRMRFTRLSVRKRQQSRKSSVADDDSFTPKSTKVTGSSKKAKKLLEKAKAIKQTVTKPVTPRRRSSRQQARSAERQPLEDCVIVEENLPLVTPSADTKVGKKRNLRSLNEVLGKVPKKLKNPNISSGLSKSGKNVKTPHITVIDDSPEASENSQDEEQFRAKQEFLKSGLPDSLKRHIAKTAALLEAYSLSGSSFQTVVHVQQRDGCPMWGLSMPACPRLTSLFPLSVAMRDLSSLCLSLGQFTCVRTMPGSKQQSSLVNRRQVFSDTVRDWLLEEIRSSNPQFPVRRFFNQFLKKQNDLLVLQEAPKQVKSSRLADHKEEGKQVEEIGVTGTGSRTKRKGEDSPGIKSKRRRFVAGQTEVCDKTLFPKDQEPPSQTAAREKLPRASRKKLKRLEQDISPDVPHCEEAKQSAAVSDTINEDVLWTEKYQPQNSSEMIGNSSAIKQLHGWLKEWKVRAEKDEKRSQMQKTDKDKSDAWDHSDFLDSDSEEEETLCNTMLITGPSGVGKTAAVYACAQELGFKVFEVNASCQRSGRQILTHLKEATQSHQVDQQGVNAHKPCFFNSLNTAKSPRKINSPKNVVSSPRKPPASPRGAGNRKGLAPKSLANFFKAHPKQKTEEKRKIHEVPKEAVKVELSLKDTERRINRNHQDTVQREQGSEESHRKMATSLILFEEVDVIFDDDYGFLSAIKTFMSTAKRPVILTTSDPSFGLMFDGIFEEIHFKTPTLINVATYLQVLCLAENLRTDTKDFVTFLTANKCDIRQSVLHLQFWAKSGGGGLAEKPLSLCGKENGISSADGPRDPASSTKAVGLEEQPTDLPKCHTGCAESLIGLSNILAPTEGLISFLKGIKSQAEAWSRSLQLLTQFQMKKVDIISSNLEFLLPLPVRVLESPCPHLPENAEVVPSGAEKAGLAEDSPIKGSALMKRRKQLLLLDDSDLFESNSVDEMFSLTSGNLAQGEGVGNKKLQAINPEASHTSHGATERQRLSPAEQKASTLVYRCLDLLAEFADNMSHLDSFTFNPKDQAKLCNLNWTESRVKNGLCDGLRIESRDWWSVHSCGEVKAAVESLAFQTCSSNISKAIDTSLDLCKESGQDPTELLTLHISKDRDELSFNQSSMCDNIAAQRLATVRTVLSNRTFQNLGNRQSNVTEILPTLRTICRLQRLKEQEKTKRRFLHYFEGIHLELPKSTVTSLAADFP